MKICVQCRIRGSNGFHDSWNSSRFTFTCPGKLFNLISVDGVWLLTFQLWISSYTLCESGAIVIQLLLVRKENQQNRLKNPRCASSVRACLGLLLFCPSVLPSFLCLLVMLRIRLENIVLDSLSQGKVSSTQKQSYSLNQLFIEILLKACMVSRVSMCNWGM